MNIVLFGGAFNPPHLGHLLVIEQAFELVPNLDELWLLPAYGSTFNKTLSLAQNRLEMCRLLIESIKRKSEKASNNSIKLCTIEIDNKTTGSTYKTLQLLKQDSLNSQHHFSFLIGSDQLPVFTKWQNWDQLLQEMPFYVYPRAGYPMKPIYGNMTPLTSPTQVITNLSSTLIRQRLAQGQSITHLVPQSIQTLLEK